MSLPGLPAIRVDLSAFAPEQQKALRQAFMDVKRNDDSLAGQFSTSPVGGGLAANLALKSDAGGGVAVSVTTATELSYVSGVTSAIQTQLGLKAPLASPALTGNPTAPTQAALSNDTKVATDAYADSAVGVEKTRALAAEALKAPVDSPTFTTTQSGVTPGAGDASKKLATTDWMPTPGPIGSTTPSTGKFTTLEATGAFTLDAVVPTPANGQVGKGDTAWTAVTFTVAAPQFANLGGTTTQYRKDSAGLVILHIGLVTGASGASAFTLPAGYRPVQQISVVGFNVVTGAIIIGWVATDGTFHPLYVPADGGVYDFSFYADQ